MKRSLFFLLFWFAGFSALANDLQWEIYTQTGGLGERGSMEEIEGTLETIIVDNSDYSHERYFVLRTRDGRYIDLRASGVKEYELRRFSRQHPIIVRIQLKKTLASKKSKLLFLQGRIWEIRQRKEWARERQKELLVPQGKFLKAPKKFRVGFISINVRGRRDDSSTSVTPDTLNSFTAHLKAMTYGKVIAETSQDDVYHINRSEMPQLNCNRGLGVIGSWAIKRAFPNGKNYEKYDRLIIIYPFKEGEDCGWWGITNVQDDGLHHPLGDSFGYMLIRSGIPKNGVDVMIHEFGHSLGLWHSAMDKDGDDYISSSEEYGDPECVMADEAFSYNPIHLKKLGVLKNGLGLERAVDGQQYELAFPLTADPLGKGIVTHPKSLDDPTPGDWGGRLLALKVRKFYINRSIEDKNFVYIRRHLPFSSYSSYSRGYETLVVGRVEVGSSFHFSDGYGDGICVIGQNPDNAKVTVSYHANMSDSHVCAQTKPAENVNKVSPPTALELVGGRNISTNPTPTIRVRGVSRGHLVRIFNDESCRNPVGFGVAKGRKVNITTVPLPPGHHTFFARSGPSFAGLSSCSTASVDYGVSTLNDPSQITLLEPSTASHQDNTPKVRIEGVMAGDTIRVYTDSLCKKYASYPVRSIGTTVEVDIWPLEEGTSHQFYVQYGRANAHRSDCWSSGLNYEVLEKMDREPLKTPTLEMPEDIQIKIGDDSWGNAHVSYNTAPMIRVRPTTYLDGELGIYTEPTCTHNVGSVATTPKRIYRKILGKRVVFDYAYVPVFLKTQELMPGDYTFYAQTRIGEVFSECSTDYARYTVLPPPGPRPNINRFQGPISVSVSEPSGATSSMRHSPTFRVDGVLSGDTVRLHRDSECLLPLKDEDNKVVADDTSALLMESELYVGAYTVYASTTRNGVRSDCSETFASYEVLAPKPSPPRSIKMVGDRAGESNTPVVEIGGGYRVYEYDEVRLYIDIDCSVEVGSGVANYNPPGDWYESGRYFRVRIQTEELPLGEHTFYATVTRDGRQSDCSRGGDSYEVLFAGNNGVLTPPQGLTLIRPGKAEGRLQRPIIGVSGVKKSDIVRLFIDDQCTQKVGEKVVLKKGSVKIRSRRLGMGTYRFYANRTHKGMTSACSTSYVDYKVLARQSDS